MSTGLQYPTINQIKLLKKDTKDLDPTSVKTTIHLFKKRLLKVIKRNIRKMTRDKSFYSVHSEGKKVNSNVQQWIEDFFEVKKENKNEDKH